MTGYQGWQSFTNDNFATVTVGINVNAGDWSAITLYNQSYSLSYNQSNGILTVRSPRVGREISVANDGNRRSQSDAVMQVYLYY